MLLNVEIRVPQISGMIHFYYWGVSDKSKVEKIIF